MKEGRLNGFSCNSRSSTAILRSTVPSRRPSRTLVDRGSIEAKYSLLLDARRQAAKREKMLQLVPHKEREYLARPEKSLQLIHLPTAAAAPERRLQLVQLPTTASPERRLQLVQMPTAAPPERKLQLVPLPSAPPLERRMKVVERSNDGKVSPEHDFQVVDLRVSIHCQGCAGKVKKLLTKMEGVMSVRIDLDEKRVTVEGRVSAAAVLQRVSKVKRAELWT